MKLLIRENKIIGSATDAYTGPEEFITAPEGMDVSKLSEYVLKDGAVERVYTVTMRQARLALLQSGLLPTIETAIDSMTDEAQKAAIKIEWEYAMDVKSDWPWVVTITEGLGMTKTDVANLFELASSL